LIPSTKQSEQEMRMQQRIGFIGMGIMGRAMAANILKQGYAVSVYNRSAGKADGLVADGAVLTSSPVALAACDTVVLMLTGPEAVDAVLWGTDGLAENSGSVKTIINMSTVPADYSRQLAEKLTQRAITLIDAPVSGSKIPAEQGKLVILAGGPIAAISEHEPLLLCMGSRVIHCGDAGAGSAMKLAVNLLLGSMMEGLAEATNLAEASGLASETFLQVISAGPMSNTLFDLKHDMLIDNNYPPQFPFRHMAKDMQYIVQAAEQLGVALPVGKRLAGLFSPDAPTSLLDQDFAAVKSVLKGTAC